MKKDDTIVANMEGIWTFELHIIGVSYSCKDNALCPQSNFGAAE